MIAPSQPFSYEASKYVLQYLSANQRLTIRLRCPQLRTLESIAPLNVNKLELDTYSLTFDHVEYEFWHHAFNYNGEEYESVDQIRIINKRTKITDRFDLMVDRSFSKRTLFLMNILLGGRRAPVIIQDLKLNNVFYHWISRWEQNRRIPKDWKMKVKRLEVFRANERVIQQLSKHIIGPLRTFRVMFIRDLQDPVFKHPLIQNALKLDLPIVNVFDWIFNAPAVFRKKEVFVNDADDFNMIDSLIAARSMNNLEVAKTIIINNVKLNEDEVLQFLLKHSFSEAREAIVDDVEINSFNIPCVSFRMDPPNELNVYCIIGTGTVTNLKIKVMPEGSARLRD